MKLNKFAGIVVLIFAVLLLFVGVIMIVGKFLVGIVVLILAVLLLILGAILTNKSYASIAIITTLLLLVVIMLYTGFFVKSEEPELEIPANLYFCAGNPVPFRANITDCMEFPIEPNELAFEKVILNPMIQEVFILVDPHGSSELGMSAYEIFKTLSSLLIRSGVVYTEYVENQSTVPVMSLGNSSTETPIIWLRESQDRNLIEVFDNHVVVDARTPYDMDAATCRLAIIAINDQFDCGVK